MAKDIEIKLEKFDSSSFKRLYSFNREHVGNIASIISSSGALVINANQDILFDDEIVTGIQNNIAKINGGTAKQLVVINEGGDILLSNFTLSKYFPYQVILFAAGNITIDNTTSGISIGNLIMIANTVSANLKYTAKGNENVVVANYAGCSVYADGFKESVKVIAFKHLSLHTAECFKKLEQRKCSLAKKVA